MRNPWRQDHPYLFRVSAFSRTYEVERTVTVSDLGRREVLHIRSGKKSLIDRLAMRSQLVRNKSGGEGRAEPQLLVALDRRSLVQRSAVKLPPVGPH